MNKQNNTEKVYKIRIDWMDANLINFMYYEGRMLEEIAGDDPDNSSIFITIIALNWRRTKNAQKI